MTYHKIPKHHCGSQNHQAEQLPYYKLTSPSTWLRSLKPKTKEYVAASHADRASNPDGFSSLISVRTPAPI